MLDLKTFTGTNTVKKTHTAKEPSTPVLHIDLLGGT